MPPPPRTPSSSSRACATAGGGGRGRRGGPADRWFVPTSSPCARRRSVDGHGGPARRAGADAGGRERSMEPTQAVDKRVEALEEVCREVRRLAHALNQPLTAVVGNAELLALDVDDPELAEGLERIVREARRMSELVQELAEAARRSGVDPAPSG
ncbi:MAG: hypothetical protein D6739_11735 [Nitrospirae bacterium]|nr:MAG: hypothetical protein D6739_11735 [Nitrospirota bacterium]